MLISFCGSFKQCVRALLELITVADINAITRLKGYLEIRRDLNYLQVVLDIDRWVD